MNQQANKLGIGVFGCGYWGINYVRVFGELPGSTVLSVCDQRAERLNEVGRRFPGVERHSDLESFLKTDGLEAVVVCTQATVHYEITRRCLEAGLHVLIEKPMTTNSVEAAQLIETATAKRKTLMVGHTFLYNTGVRKMKQLIDQHDLGTIYYIHARRTNLGPIRQDVNAMWDLASHDVSIFNYLLNGKPQWVSAVGVNILPNPQEDVGFVSLSYPENILGNIHASWAEPNKVREVVVVGSKKRVVFDDINTQEQVRIFEKGVSVEPIAASYGEYQFLMRDGDIISPRIEVSEPLKNQCKHFLDCVSTGTPPLTGGQIGLEVVQVMEAINESIAKHGAPVEILQA